MGLFYNSISKSINCPITITKYNILSVLEIDRIFTIKLDNCFGAAIFPVIDHLRVTFNNIIPKIILMDVLLASQMARVFAVKT